MDGHWEEGKRHGGFIFTFPNGERCHFNLCGNAERWQFYIFSVTRDINDNGIWLDYKSDYNKLTLRHPKADQICFTLSKTVSCEHDFQISGDLHTRGSPGWVAQN